MFGLSGGNEMEVVVSGDASGLNSALAGARASVGGFVATVGTLGAAIGAAGAALTGVGVKAAADFDEALQESVAIMGDVDAAMREDLANTAREVAATTTASADEAARSYYYLASAGLDAAESMQALPTVQEFAAAGAMDMASATDAATDIASAFGIEMDNLTKVTDTLTGTFTGHNQTAEGMADAMSKVAPVAAGLGLSIEEVSAAIGMFGDQGIKGAQAGTQLKSAYRTLAKPTAELQDTIDELGLSIYDSEGNMRSMADIVGQLESKGITAADAIRLFGSEAGPGMAVLLGQGSDALRENTERLANMEGATKDVAETQRQTFNKQLDIAQGKLHDVAIAIGQALLPALTGMLGGVNQTLDVVREWVNGLDDATIQAASFASTVVGIAGSIAMLNPVLGAVAGVVGALAIAWKTNLGGMRDATQEVISVAVDEFAPLVTQALQLIDTVTETVSSAFAVKLGYMGTSATGLVDTLKTTLIGGIRTVADTIGGILDTLESLWFEHRTAIIHHIWEFIDTAREVFDQLRVIVGVVTTVLGDILGVFQDRFGEIATAVGGFLNALIGNWRSQFQIILGVTRTIIDVLVGVFRTLRPLIVPTVNLLIDAIILAFETLTTIVETVTAIRERVVSTFAGFVDPIRATVATVVNAVLTVWRGLTAFVDTVRQVFTGVKTTTNTQTAGFRQIIDSAIQAVLAVWDRLQGVVATVRKWLGLARDTATTIIDALVTNVVTPIAELVTTFTDHLSAIAGLFTEYWGALWEETIAPILYAIRDGINQVLGEIMRLWDEHGAEIKRELGETWDAINNNIVKPAMAVLEQTVGVALDALNQKIQTVLLVIQAFWAEWGDEIMAVVDTVFSTVQAIVETVLPVVRTVIETTLNVLLALWNTFGDEIVAIVQFAFDLIASVIGGVMDTVLTLIRATLNLIQGDFDESLNLVADLVDRIFSGILDFLETWATGFVGAVVDLLEDAYQAFVDFANDLIFGSLIPDMLGAIIDELTSWDFLETIQGILDDVLSAAGEFGDDFIQSVKDTVTGIVDWLKSTGSNLFGDGFGALASAAKNTFNRMLPDTFSIPKVTVGGQSLPGGVKVPEVSVGGQSFNIPQLNTGGIIEESGLYYGHAGERVMKPSETRQYDRGDVGGGDTWNLEIYADSYEGGAAAADGFVDRLRANNYRPNL